VVRASVPLRVVEVRDVVERRDDVVDRDDVDAPSLEPDQREPLRQRPPEPLEQREEVHRTVDLVDVPGPRVADDDAGPVHPPRHGALGPHDALGLVLGREVRVVEPGGLVEHPLGEPTLERAGHRDGRDVVEARVRPEPGDRLEHVPGALDVGLLLGLLRRLEVVDGGAVEDVVDVAGDALERLDGQPEPGLGDVTDERLDPAGGRAPLADALLEPFDRALADQAVDGAGAGLEQPLDELAADEPGRTRDEVAHDPVSSQCGVLAGGP
jgi:hypothetical protein